MNNHHSASINKPPLLNQLRKRNVYHQAGHAAAIYLGNQEKRLPVVHFQISLKTQENTSHNSRRDTRFSGKYLVTLEGGLLIQTLPVSFAEAIRHWSPFEQVEYCRAFEADVTNLLVGPLAEAKYVALRDDEPFNANLVYLNALQYYGGKQDLEIINEYMGCFLPDEAERKQKLTALFLAAYSFISKQSNWNAITRLAEFILDVSKPELNTVIHCEDIIALLEPECEPVAGQYTPLLPGYLETLILR